MGLARGASAAEARAIGVDAAAATAAKVGAVSEGVVGGAQQQLQVQSQVEGMPLDALEQSPQYRALIEQGYDPSAARMAIAARAGKNAGLSAAVVDSVTNLFGGAVLGRIIGEGGPLATRVAKGAADEGITEAVQSAGEHLGQNAALRDEVDPRQHLDEGLLESALQGLFVGGASGGAMTGLLGKEAQRDGKISDAEAVEQGLREIVQFAQASRLRERGPDTFAEFIRQASDETQAEDVFVSPDALGDALFQSEAPPPPTTAPPSEVERARSAARQSLVQRSLDARATGQDVKIPLDEFVTAFAGTPEGDVVLRHAKFDPNGWSKAEAEEFIATRGEQLQRDIETAIERHARDNEWQQQASAVRDDIFGQVKATKRYVDSVGERYADLYGAFYSTMADRLGTTPSELYARFPIRVQSQPLTGDQLAQGVTFFSPLERATTTSKQTKASPEQWLATLKKAPGVKQEELEWTGLPEWLAEQNAPVTREELLAFVRAGGVQVEEVVLGEPDPARVEEIARGIAREAYLNGDQTDSSNYVEQDPDGQWYIEGLSVRYETEDEARAVAAELDGQDADEAADRYADVFWGDFEENARSELAAEGTDGAKFESYTEDGGEDYRELLLTLPEGVRGNPETSFRESGHFGEHPVIAHIRFKSRRTVDGKSVMFIEEVQSDWHQKGRDKGYWSPDAGRLAEAKAAYIAANDAWEQARDAKAPKAEQERLYEARRAALDRWSEAEGHTGVPDAPFKSTWPALSMKRAIRWAVDNGFDAVAWTTGEQQRERYNLGQTVGPVKVARLDDGRYQVMTPQNANVIHAVQQRALGEYSQAGSVFHGGVYMTAAQIEEVFGRDLGGRMVALADAGAPTADTLAAAREARNKADEALLAELASERYDVDVEALNQEADRLEREATPSTVTLDGEDLKIGGEGMLAFYDRNLVNITNKVLKGTGAKVEMVPVEGMGPLGSAQEAKRLEAEIQRKAGLSAYGITTRAEAEERFAEWEKMKADGVGSPVKIATWAMELKGVLPLIDALEALKAEGAARTNPGFYLTDDLKRQAQQGFALFQINRGAYSPATDTITLLQNADLSTFLHESGHFFLEVMHRLASDPGAPQQIRDDFDKLLKWFGVKDRATWDGMTLEQKREHHEKFARGFEAYLFTGKAPSVTLRDLFRQFRAWLIAVYKKARNLNVTVSPTVRGVMDRMLATDAQIEEAEAARSMMPLFADEQASGMNKDQWQAYQALAAGATHKAAEELEKRSLGNMQWLNNARGRELRKLQKRAAQIRKATRAQVEAEVTAQPVYRAQQFLKKGVLDGAAYDGPHKLSIVEVDALYPDEAARNVVKTALGYGKYGMLGSDENALHPEQAAELFGFTSADHLIRSLIEAEPMNDLVDGLTEQRLLEDHGDATDPQSIEQAADAVVHNENRARAVAAELSALQRASSVRSGRTDILASAARNFAKETIARLRVRDVKPALYEAAAARAGKNAMTALGKGDSAAAAAEKRNQLINLYASKEALAARDEVEKALDYFARLQGAGAIKSIDASYREQIDNILEAMDLRRGQSLKAIDKRTSLEAWVEAQRELGFEPVIPDDLQRTLGKRSYKNMTVEELRGVVDTVRNIEHLGRLKTKLLTAKKDRDFASAVAKVADAINGNAYADRPDALEQRGFVAGVKKGWYQFLAMHRKFASIAREMDGGKDGGFVWEYFVRPMNAAGDREAVLRAQATAKLQEIIAPVLGKPMSRKVFIPEIAASLSLEGRLAVALNMGNATNKQRILDGDNWTPAQLDAVARTLTAEEWAVAQGVWDYINSFWPDIAAKERRVTGIAPEKVEAEPLRVETADGQSLDLPGGYYPIKYDADRSSRAEADTAAEIAAQFTRGLYSRATTRRGHTKARADTVKRPVRKDLGVVTQHLTEVIHDLAWHEFLIDATRLLRAKPIDTAIRYHYGPETLAAMRNALTDMAAGDIPAQHVFERAWAYLRTGVSIAGMGYSVTTALLQPTGLVQSAKRIGPKWLLKGLGDWFGSADGMAKKFAWINEQSEFMRTRMLTQQRELAEIRNKISNKGKARSFLDETMFLPIAKMQMLADVPTWLGQYEKSIDGGEDHERAVALADQAVLDAQGGGQVKDLAQIQRGSQFQKLFTNFYSYFNVQYNMLAESVADTRRAGPAGIPHLVGDVMTILWLPAVLQVLIFAALRGDTDDPEKVAADTAKAVVASNFGLLVGLRDIGSVISSDGRVGAPAGIAYDRLSKFYVQAGQGEIDEAFLRSANQLGGVLFHYPAAQVDRTARGFEALATGQSSNPLVVAVGPPPKQ